MENRVVSQRRQAKLGSGRLRANRPRQPEGHPPVMLPDWFFSKNVKCAGEPNQSGSLATYGEDSSAGSGCENAVEAEKNGQAMNFLSDDPATLPNAENSKYTIHIDVFNELLCTVRADLTLRPPRHFALSSIPRPLTLLQCPKDGGTYYLDSIVETIATKLGADLVRLDADDIAQLVSTYVDENLAWTFSKTALLGYDAAKAAGKLEEYDGDLKSGEEDFEIDDEDGKSARSRFLYPKNFPIGISARLFRDPAPRRPQPKISSLSEARGSHNN